jgi:tape measure domain-containing protein
VAELYTIKLEDAVTANAYRIAKAYVDVSYAAQDMAKAVRSSDVEMRRAAAANLAFARTQLTAANAAKNAANAVARIGPKMGPATGATKSLTGAMAAGTGQGFKFSYMMNALANQAVNLGFALVRNLGSGLLVIGEGLYKVADLATQAHMSFANFWGGQESGDKILKESIDLAKQYGFALAGSDGLIAQMKRFGAAGFNQEQSKGLLRFGADMMAAGRSMQDVNGIFLAMTQIQGKGKLQAEELTQQLAERGINAGKVWKILGGILHKTVPEVMALQKAGKIASGIALNAIVQAGVEGVHGARIGEAGQKVADETVGGLGRKMSTLIETEVFDAVDKSTPAIVKGMQALFKGLGAGDTGNLEANLTNALKGVGK